MLKPHVTEQSPPNFSFTITLHDEVATYFLVDSGVEFEGNRSQSATTLQTEPAPVPPNARPVLTFGSRVYLDDQGAVRLCPPLGEPSLERRPGSLRMRFTRREIAVAGNNDLLWSLLRLADGDLTTDAILEELPVEWREIGARMLASLASTGGFDVSGHPFRRFMHRGTKRGVLPVGVLDGESVRLWATNGNYRTYPEAPRLEVEKKIPERLAPFHALTRSRRSYRDFNREPVARADFEAIITTALGVTGIVEWGAGELPLRAHPSPGALYPIEVYPVVFAVDDLEAGIYHYHPVDNVLEVIRTGIDRGPFLDAALVPEREMISGVAVLFCLSAVFERSEHKYGEGIYRGLAAEAGHISANLLLAATALGLQARPWGGIFDTMVNALLGFDPDEEQFVLGVLLGHAQGNRIDGAYRPVP